MVENALKMYIDFYQQVLGIYGYAGRKSASEKFAGADSTLTYEILAPDGKVIQGCTSHNLGQNFSKVFQVKYQNKAGREEFVWQTSWGLSTRSIGALILTHGDDNGLVLPPQIAPTQVVIIPIVTKSAGHEAINKLANKAFELLEGHNIRVKLDDSSQSPGWKFNQYDLEGVPLRIEIGPTEVSCKQVSIKLRDGHSYPEIELNEVAETVEKLLSQLQETLLSKSKQNTLENTRQADNYQQFKEIMNTSRGFIEAFWCEDKNCEAKIKEETKATTRCLPLESIEANGECVYCKRSAKHRWFFGQSY